MVEREIDSCKKEKSSTINLKEQEALTWWNSRKIYIRTAHFSTKNSTICLFYYFETRWMNQHEHAQYIIFTGHEWSFENKKWEEEGTCLPRSHWELFCALFGRTSSWGVSRITPIIESYSSSRRAYFLQRTFSNSISSKGLAFSAAWTCAKLE